MADDADVWDGDRVERWLRQAEGLERQLAPVSEVLLDAARLAPGESVLDVGCGTGPTTVAAAALVGPTGRVRGLDVSSAMLAAAAGSAAGAPGAPIEWIEADAVTWAPPTTDVEVVLSRFGVMFFSDPARAFANLAAATVAGGRLSVAVWRRRDESPLFAVPLHAAIGALRSGGGDDAALDALLAADGGGPFSLHDEGALTDLLGAAGWADVTVTAHTLDLRFAGGLPPAAAAEAALDFGPTRLAVADAGEDERVRARAAIAESFADHLDDDGTVVLAGAINVVTAVRAG